MKFWKRYTKRELKGRAEGYYTQYRKILTEDQKVTRQGDTQIIKRETKSQKSQR